VNYDEMDGDRLRLHANRNCYRLSRVSWALLKFLVWSAKCRFAHCRLAQCQGADGANKSTTTFLHMAYDAP